VKWFRKHVKHGSRLALLALVVQFALSFGHFHAIAAKAAPAIQFRLTQADLATAAGLAALEVGSEAAQQSQPSNHDSDQQPADACCGICAAISLAHNVLFATPPVLLLPQAVELLCLTADAGFDRLNSVHPAFQSRAPPLS
jgi:hypothetical protein